MTTITQSRPAEFGDDHSYSLDPAPGPGCKVIWSIDGQEVTVGSEVGGLKVDGIGADGTMTVEVIGDIKKDMKVSAKIKCPGLQPDKAGPIKVKVKEKVKVKGGGASGVDIIIEIFETVLLPVTGPAYGLWELFYQLAKLLKKLGVDWPVPEEIKKDQKKIGKILPKWAKNL